MDKLRNWEKAVMITAIIAFCVFALMAFRVWIEWRVAYGDFSLVKLHRSDPHSTWGMLVSALVACFIGLKARLRFVDNDPTDPRFPK